MISLHFLELESEGELLFNESFPWFVCPSSTPVTFRFSYECIRLFWSGKKRHQIWMDNRDCKSIIFVQPLQFLTSHTVVHFLYPHVVKSTNILYLLYSNTKIQTTGINCIKLVSTDWKVRWGNCRPTRSCRKKGPLPPKHSYTQHTLKLQTMMI